jgi:large subunit ribosomal protein L23
VSEDKKAPEKKKAEKKPQAAAASARRFAVDRLMNVVLAPVVSEKSTFVADRNRQYVFRVADDATKPQIKAAVELMFKTKVEGVTVANVKGKERRFGRTIGRKKSWKKAYVRLAEGQEINFAATQ